MSKYLIENLFGIEGWSIAWYGVIIAVGMVLGVILAIYRARKQGLKDDLIFDFILLALPIAIVCARGYYVVFEWNSYSGDILSIFKIWKGGLAIYGGVIGGLVTAILFCRHHKFPLFRFLDLVVPSLVLGQAIGRWGNFVNQEAFGNLVTDSSLQFFPHAALCSSWQLCVFGIENGHLSLYREKAREEKEGERRLWERCVNRLRFSTVSIAVAREKRERWLSRSGGLPLLFGSPFSP